MRVAFVQELAKLLQERASLMTMLRVGPEPLPSRHVAECHRQPFCVVCESKLHTVLNTADSSGVNRPTGQLQKQRSDPSSDTSECCLPVQGGGATNEGATRITSKLWWLRLGHSGPVPCLIRSVRNAWQTCNDRVKTQVEISSRTLWSRTLPPDPRRPSLAMLPLLRHRKKDPLWACLLRQDWVHCQCCQDSTPGDSQHPTPLPKARAIPH